MRGRLRPRDWAKHLEALALQRQRQESRFKHFFYPHNSGKLSLEFPNFLCLIKIRGSPSMCRRTSVWTTEAGLTMDPGTQKLVETRGLQGKCFLSYRGRNSLSGVCP